MKKSSVIHPHRCLNFQLINLLHISMGNYIERVLYPCYNFHVSIIDRILRLHVDCLVIRHFHDLMGYLSTARTSFREVNKN